ncbi:MAG TPA: hypothetical protein PLA73_08700, partial [Sedimentibacter sp.]|nr:hypothetical protein [Sedimentibacter sp.]
VVEPISSPTKYSIMASGVKSICIVLSININNYIILMLKINLIYAVIKFLAPMWGTDVYRNLWLIGTFG